MWRTWTQSEKRMGLILILPTLITILVIAIWPVLRSFWISLYDVELNNPAKTEIHHSYGIDMEKFVNIFPLLTKNLDESSAKADPQTKQQLEEIKRKTEQLKAVLDGNPQFSRQYKQVDDILFDGQSVPDDLKIFKLDKAQADKVTGEMKAIRQQLAEMTEAHQLTDNTLAGLSNGLTESLIQPNFVGLKYYEKLLTGGRLWASLTNTMIFTVVSVGLELVLGLMIALVVNRSFRGRGLVRAAVLIPWAIPTVISALMWKFMFDGQNGIMAKFFAQIGLVSDMGLLLTTKWGSMFAVIFADVWKTTPFMSLLLLAGLQMIPESLYEAAAVDGASKVQQFFRITLPQLKSTILVSLLFRTLDAFRVFDLVYVLTGGGPANSTETISIYAYKTMFAQMDFGQGSALSVIVFICVAIISMIFVKLLGSDLISDGQGK
ncbi:MULTISPECIES: carbohydrate ABC transporter permease [unclassified Thermoactinomyces]|uniref:carbohydrate ABC transporter permease n=1 Tax=unclassified Thermoactinomyces TaxID=2634588 RepID=UPI0018DB2EE3|nr:MULTISPECIES: sugar ABC transporter permease [unclassified Thermoactinomyces]MBH8597134.1 ABC transporter permease subunit [Thermoactinomyces sp. CICC 10523]MBH8606195.1 ABC transporter permease subunit [Thermoactinomyces sp. CICC 10521]